MVQHAFLVVEPEQQRSHRIVRVLVPAEAGDDAVRRAGVLDLEHRARAGRVRQVFRLRDHAVETRAFELCEPLGGLLAIAGHRRQVQWGRRAREQHLELFTTLALRRIDNRASFHRQQIEGDE